MHRTLSHPIAILAALSLSLPVAAAAATVTVSAGDFDREHTVVTFQLPESAGQLRQLETASGNRLPLQIDTNGQASFILPKLAANASLELKLIPESPENFPEVLARRADRTLEFQQGDIFIARYQAEPSDLPRANINPIYRRGGYLHPIQSPSGTVVTDDYPGNHVHHHGIWFPWTKTRFQDREPDFWNMGQGSGTVEFVALDSFWSGPVHAGLISRHRFVDLLPEEPVTALHESWEVKVYRVEGNPAPYHQFDLVSTQTCATSDPLILPEYHYGGLGFRGHWDWNGAENTRFLTSTGETDRIRGNTSRARWCHIGGKVGDPLTGIAILGHPDNFRAPQPMRLHPTEPFFCFAPEQLGDMRIEPGQPYVSRYRFIVADGPPDAELIDRLWNDYAHPPAVTVRTQ
jgi:hypothetical protein